MKTATSITISQDGAWAGTGTLRDGRIEDCAAVLGPAARLDHASGEQQDAAERAYAAIEDAIASGADSATADGVRYTWEIDR